MKVLVTGASGFIGRYLVKELLKQGYKVRCLVRKTSNIKNLKNCEIVYGDILDKNSLKRAIKGIDIVFHLIGMGDVTSTSEKKYREFSKINIQGTKNLLDNCGKVKKFIYFSSIAALGVIKDKIVNEETESNAYTAYEKSKKDSEKLVLKYNFPVVIIRPSMVFGPFDKHSMINFMRFFINLGFFPMPGNGKNKVALVYVKDLVKASVNAIKIRKKRAIYNITDNCSFNELVNVIAKSLNKKVKIIYLPISLVKLGVFLLENFSKVFGVTPLFTLYRVDSMTSNRVYDLSKAKKDLKFKPSNLEKALRETIKWKR